MVEQKPNDSFTPKEQPAVPENESVKPTEQPSAPPSLSDEEILKRANMINEARKLEQEEMAKQLEMENAKKAAEAERIRQEEELKKEDELRRARELVEADDAKKAANMPPPKKHTGVIVTVVILVLLIAIAGVGFISYSVTSTTTHDLYEYPHSTTYTFWLPQGSSNIFGIDVSVVGDAHKMMITYPGAPSMEITQGQTIQLGPYNLLASLFWGLIKPIKTQYKLSLTYQGISADNKITFKTTLKSSDVIPEWFLNIALTKSGISYQKN